jgi:hypothetical protein
MLPAMGILIVILWTLADGTVASADVRGQVATHAVCQKQGTAALAADEAHTIAQLTKGLSAKLICIDIAAPAGARLKSPAIAL